MRIERLNENKVKVTLTSDDLNCYDINLQKLHYNSTELHSFLFRIMETIHRETGFNPYNGQIVVEAQSNGSGLSIVISKVRTAVQRVTEITEGNKKIKAKIKEKRTGTNIYYFETFDDMCAAVSVMDEKVHEGSALYKYNDKYYYLLDFENPQLQDKDLLCETISILAEFAKIGSSSDLRYVHIKEFGSSVAEGESLVAMAQGLQKINK